MTCGQIDKPVKASIFPVNVLQHRAVPRAFLFAFGRLYFMHGQPQCRSPCVHSGTRAILFLEGDRKPSSIVSGVTPKRIALVPWLGHDLVSVTRRQSGQRAVRLRI